MPEIKNLMIFLLLCLILLSKNITVLKKRIYTKAIYEDMPDNNEEIHLKKWLRFGESAKNQALNLVGNSDKEKLLSATEKFNVVEQIKNLLTYPVVTNRVNNNKLFIQGWYYHIEDGAIEYFNPIEYRFLPIEESEK